MSLAQPKDKPRQRGHRNVKRREERGQPQQLQDVLIGGIPTDPFQNSLEHYLENI